MNDAAHRVSTIVLGPLESYYGERPLPTGANPEFIAATWVRTLSSFSDETLKKAVDDVLRSHPQDRWPTLKMVYDTCAARNSWG